MSDIIKAKIKQLFVPLIDKFQDDVEAILEEHEDELVHMLDDEGVSDETFDQFVTGALVGTFVGMAIGEIRRADSDPAALDALLALMVAAITEAKAAANQGTS